MILLWWTVWLLSPVQDCEDHAAWITRLNSRYLAVETMDQAFQGDMETAKQVQHCFVEGLISQLGPRAGYKAALTNPAARKRFGTEQPLMGVLLQKMLLPDKTPISLNFGSRPMLEGDLLVKVGSDAINEAGTEDEVLAALESVIPFMELADLVYAPGVPLSGPAITAVNAGARAGIMGEEIPLRSASWREALAAMNVVMLDDQNQILAEGNTAALLGHPLKAVIWIRDQVLAGGGRLKKGDLLSLGSVTPPVFRKTSGSVRLRYSGGLLEHPIEIEVMLTATGE